MKHEEIKFMIPLLAEGELDDKERRIVEEHLGECEECRREFEEFGELEAVLTEMQYKKPDEEVWEKYSDSVYNRLERKTAWIVFIAGVLIILAFAGWKFMENLITDPDASLILIIGLFTFISGSIILFVSILKEQLFYRKKERYEEIDI